MDFDFQEDYEDNENEYIIDREATFKNHKDTITVKDFRDYYYSKFINDTELNKKEEPPCENKTYKTKIIDTFVNIDSRNRDKAKFPNANNYSVYLDREYTNVKEVKVVSTQFPNISKNIFKDPILLKNDGIHWQRQSENSQKIFDYSFVSEKRLRIFVNDMTIDILDYLFEGLDDIDYKYMDDRMSNNINQFTDSNDVDDENVCRYLIREMMKIRKNENNVFDISFAEFIDAENSNNASLKMFEKFNLVYHEKYVNNKKIKITLNEKINGTYLCKSFSTRFYSFGDNWKDCFVLLGIDCSLIEEKNYLNFESLQVNSKYICNDYYGIFQVLNNEENSNMNDTFKTFSTEIDNGLYDEKSISFELSEKMTNVDPDNYEFDAEINELKNLSKIRCFKKRLLGNNCLFFRPYLPLLDRLTNKKKKNFIVMFKNVLHKFVENDTITFKIDRKNKRFNSNGLSLFSHIKDSIYDKEFKVHMCKFYILKELEKSIVYRDILGELHDITISKTYLHFPLCHNFFYIDLMDHFSRETCENLFTGNDSYGMGYYDFGKFSIKISENSPISCFGDLIVNYEKIKLINGNEYCIQSVLGFKCMDTTDYLVKRCYREPQNKKLFYSENHKLLTDDIIFLNNEKIKIKYVSDDYFSIENQVVKESDKYFYNTDPIYFYGNKTINTKTTDNINIDKNNVLESNDYETEINRDKVIVHENNILFKITMNSFFLNSDIFECLQFPDVPIKIKNTNNGWYYFISAIDEKPLKNFWTNKSKMNYNFSRKKIINITFYNHQLTTGINNIKINGFLPLDGTYIIFKKNKDQFSIISKYMSDDGIYKKYKSQYTPFNIEVSSDYFGFKNEVKNTDLFGNSTEAIKFEFVPYILCTSTVLGGNIQNIYNNGNNNRILPLQELTNVFMKLNMPGKAFLQDSRTIYDRFVQSNKTFQATPMPSLSFIDLQFWYPSGIAYDFQNFEHSFVILIREYFDYNNDINYSTKRGNTDDINTISQVLYQNK
jgi:hypothetical protein